MNWKAATVAAIGVRGLCVLAAPRVVPRQTATEERVKVRSVIIAARLDGSMTAMLYGAHDFTALRMLTDKPTIACCDVLLRRTPSGYHDNWL